MQFLQFLGTRQDFRRVTLWLPISVAAIGLTGCGDQSQSNGNNPPTPLAISSPGSASFAENGTTSVYQVTTTGGSGASISYGLSGADAQLFDLGPTGSLTFKVAPDFETPKDTGADNTYDVIVQATQSGVSVSRPVAIAITNVADKTVTAQVGGTYTRAIQIVPNPGQRTVFVAQANGEILVMDPATSSRGTTYLTVAGLSTTATPHNGLLAIAPAPDYVTSGKLYALATSSSGSLEIRRYGRLASGAGDAASMDVVLRVPYSNGVSLGGWIGFGADGLLYVALGNDGTSQGAGSLLGKILRIDPSRDDYPTDPVRNYGIPPSNPFVSGPNPPEVYAIGFQDPWRASFDGANLLVGDTAPEGQLSGLYLIRPQDAGLTFGSAGTNRIRPVVYLTNSTNAPSTIIGGFTYRGPSPDLANQYIFAIYISIGPGNGMAGAVKTATSDLTQGANKEARSVSTFLQDTSIYPTAFGEDSQNNIYYTNGTIIYQVRYQ